MSVMKSTHRSALSSAFLLLVVLTGWIGAPLAHEIEHALERADLMHIHDVRDQVSLRNGCDMLPDLAEECPISLTKVQAVGMVPLPVVLPLGTKTSWAFLSTRYTDASVSHNNVRGPPIRA